jgi:uncharacterized protein
VARIYRVDPTIARRARRITAGAADASSEWVKLGRLAEDGPPKEVVLDLAREHVVAIVGKRGSGKSFTLGALLEGLCTEENETAINNISRNRSTLLFDTLNIFQWMNEAVDEDSGSSEHVRRQGEQLRRWKLAAVKLDVELWVPAGFGERTAADAREFSIRTGDMEAADWGALLGVDVVNDILGQLVSQLHGHVTTSGWADSAGAERGPKPAYEVADLLDCLRNDPQIVSDYQAETRRAMRQRLSAYESLPLFSTTGTQLHELLEPGRLTIILLSGIPDDLRLTIVFLLIRRLLFARSAASEAAKALELGASVSVEQRGRLEAALENAPPKTWVVVDEAQNVFPSAKQTTASATLLRYVREGRNFGLSLAFTTQQPSAIDPGVMAQVDTLIAQTLTVDRDLKNVLANLKSRAPTSVRLGRNEVSLVEAIRALDVGQAFVTDTGSERGFFMNVRPRTSVHGGFEG